MAALTRLLEVRAARKQKLQPSDYFLMRDVVAYLHDYPDQVHHPTEDQLFERLGRRKPELREEVRALQSQHLAMAEQSGLLLTQLEQAADGVSRVSEKALRVSIRDFVSGQNSHMQRENHELFPAAVAELRPADWQFIARRVSLHQDPLFGPQVHARHRTLFEYLIGAEREFTRSLVLDSVGRQERLIVATNAIEDGPAEKDSHRHSFTPSTGTKPRLVFFDLDGTLLDGYSVLFFLARRQLSQAPGSTERLQQFTAVLRHIAGQTPFESALAELARGMRGVSDAEMWRLSEEVFARDLVSRIYPEARELIRQHQQRGDRVAILSSATPYQVEPVARELGVEHVLCTQLAVASGKLTGMLLGPACYGAQKLQVAKEFAQKHRQQLSASVFYSDGHEDLPLLRAVAQPIATNPDSRLTKVAREQGWLILRFAPRGLPGWREVIATGFVYGSLIPSFLLAAPAGLAASAGLAQSPRRAISNIGFNLWGKLGTAVAGLELDVKAEQHLWSQRPAVFVFNHQSAVDALIIARLLKKDFTGLAKQEMQSNPLLGPVLSFADVVFIDREKGGAAGIQAAIAMLKSGISIVVAPEGRRSDGRRLGPFKKGAFEIAMHAGVPVIPIVIENASDALPRSAWFIRPARIRISVLKPISTKGWRASTLDSTLDRHITACRKAFLKVLAQKEEDSG